MNDTPETDAFFNSRSHYDLAPAIEVMRKLERERDAAIAALRSTLDILIEDGYGRPWTDAATAILEKYPNP